MKLSDEQIAFIDGHRADDVGKLALMYGGRNRKGLCALDGEELRFALIQIEARQRLKEKLPTILENREFVFPTRISTEQASSEVTAKVKAEIVRELLADKCGMVISADLTGGLGIDTIFMGKESQRHHYVEINPEHSAAAEVNLPLFMNNVTVHDTDAESFLKETNERFDFVYADPARRNENNSKVFRLEDCIPNILELKPVIMSKSHWLIVKLSPMLDVSQAIEKLEAERVIVVSVNDECKEMIVVCGQENERRRCSVEAIEINRHGNWRVKYNDCVHGSDFKEEYGVPEVGMTIYEPYAAMMKAGLFKQLATKYGMKMLAPSSHLFFNDSGTSNKKNNYTETAASREDDFPGRKFVIKEISTFTKSSMKGIKKANITIRNFPMSVAGVRKRFEIQDGGDEYLFLTTDIQGNKLIINCKKIR